MTTLLDTSGLLERLRRCVVGCAEKTFYVVDVKEKKFPFGVAWRDVCGQKIPANDMWESSVGRCRSDEWSIASRQWRPFNLARKTEKPFLLTFMRNYSLIVVFGVFMLLSGCTLSAAGQLVTGALQVAGLVKPDPKPEAAKEVPLKIFAGGNLNADAKGRPLAVVVKLYKLRNNTTFMSAPYEALNDPARERQLIGQDLLEVREIVLTPGQQLEFKEKLAPETGFLAVAVLFRSPAPERWRFSFAVDDKNTKGVNIGVHACAMTVSQGVTSGVAGDVQSLNGVRCTAGA
ncbi:MAG: type VI secretion system lipoprotein TssJ [Rhodocyclaceae bacterium]